jgi:hypothetical protein
VFGGKDVAVGNGSGVAFGLHEVMRIAKTITKAKILNFIFPPEIIQNE